MNTHRAVIETSVPPSIYPIAAGPQDFCEKYLATYIENHPLGEFDNGLVLEVVELGREAQAALDTEPANAVEAHHKEVIRGLQAQLDAVKAVAADFQTRGDAIEAMDNNGSIYATRAEGRGIGYLEAARSIYKALEG